MQNDISGTVSFQSLGLWLAESISALFNPCWVFLPLFVWHWSFVVLWTLNKINTIKQQFKNVKSGTPG